MPEEVSTPEELSVSLQQEPLKWVTYLNDITNYVTFLQSHIQEQEKTLQARESYAETVTTEQNFVLREALDHQYFLKWPSQRTAPSACHHSRTSSQGYDPHSCPRPGCPNSAYVVFSGK